MEQTRILTIKNVIVFVLIVGIIALAIFSLDILMMLFASYVITCAVSPLINKMETKMPRIWAVSLVLLGLILGSFIIILPLISVSIKEAINLANSFSTLFNNFDKYLSFKIFDKSLGDFLTFEALKDPISQGAQAIIQNSLVAGKSIANFITTLLAISIIVFYFAYDEKRLTDKVIEFFPPQQKEKAKLILDNISSKVGNYIFAQGLAMVFVGVVTSIGLLLIGNNHAILLGFITCILDIIPVIGPSVAVAVGLISASMGGVGYVLLTFVVYIFAQWAQNQLVRPILFGKLLNMHPLMIIVALLLCARFFGFWGIILAPAIASVICVLVDELYLKRINGRQ